MHIFSIFLRSECHSAQWDLCRRFVSSAAIVDPSHICFSARDDFFSSEPPSVVVELSKRSQVLRVIVQKWRSPRKTEKAAIGVSGVYQKGGKTQFWRFLRGCYLRSPMGSHDPFQPSLTTISAPGQRARTYSRMNGEGAGAREKATSFFSVLIISSLQSSGNEPIPGAAVYGAPCTTAGWR